MKKIPLIVFLMAINSIAHAGSWMSEADIARFHAGERPITVHKTRSRCISKESGGPCRDIAGKDLRRHSMQDLMEDDLSRPLYGPKLKSLPGLDDLAACQVQMPTHCDDQTPGYEVRAVCADELPSSTYELYCIASSPQGYQQRSVRRLILDAALAAQADADAAAKAQEKLDRASKATTREASLRQCARAADLTAQQSKNCLQSLIKEVYKLRLSVDDL